LGKCPSQRTRPSYAPLPGRASTEFCVASRAGFWL
ncbi:uncharacterized protein METZ01_LOCUS191858, partial [marine metagenome]